jgi:hypothetical protein
VPRRGNRKARLNDFIVQWLATRPANERGSGWVLSAPKWVMNRLTQEGCKSPDHFGDLQLIGSEKKVRCLLDDDKLYVSAYPSKTRLDVSRFYWRSTTNA